MKAINGRALIGRRRHAMLTARYKSALKKWRYEVGKIMDDALIGRTAIIISEENSGEPASDIVGVGTMENGKMMGCFWRRWKLDHRNMTRYTIVPYSEMIDVYRQYYSRRYRIPINHLLWAEVDETFIH